MTAARIYVGVTRQRHLHPDDYALFVAVALYTALAALYIIDLPYLYGFLDYTAGIQPFTPDLPTTLRNIMMINFAVTPLFWVVLWSVKLSLLLFFKRIISRTALIGGWWAVLAFTIVTFLGCIVSEFTSCDTIRDFTISGACVSLREQRAQLASLYYSFAADVVTELARG